MLAPLTGVGVVDRIITELAVFDVVGQLCCATSHGLTEEEVRTRTEPVPRSDPLTSHVVSQVHETAAESALLEEFEIQPQSLGQQ